MLTPIKQGDSRWGSIKIGTGNQTIAQVGCFITSLSMLAHTTPDQVNTILTQGDGYVYGNLLVSSVAAKLLGLQYDGRSTTKPVFACIAETHHFAPRVPQHFFVALESGRILDPLDGKEKDNPYKIVSYRLFHEIQNSELDDAVQFATDHGLITQWDEPLTDKRLAIILKRYHDTFNP